MEAFVQYYLIAILSDKKKHDCQKNSTRIIYILSSKNVPYLVSIWNLIWPSWEITSPMDPFRNKDPGICNF